MKKFIAAIALIAAGTTVAQATPLRSPGAAAMAAVMVLHKAGAQVVKTCVNAKYEATKIAVIGEFPDGSPAVLLITRDGDKYELASVHPDPFTYVECANSGGEIIWSAQE